MAAILGLTAPFFGLILLGYLCGRWGKRPEQGLAWMQFFIVYVALPALFFKLVAATPIEKLTEWRFIAATTLSTLIVFCLAYAIARLLLSRAIPEATLQAIAGAYSNIGYMGPGLTVAALGAGASAPTALIFAFDNALLFTLAPLLMGIAGRGGTSATAMVLQIVKGVFTHPFIIATLIGVAAALVGFVVPGPIDTMLTWLKGAAAPCALFTMGVVIALRPANGLVAEVPHLVLIKLVVHPLLVLVLLSTFGDFDPVWVQAAMLMAALPPALNVFVIAQQYDVWVRQASSMVLIGTIVSVFTVTALLYGFAHGWVPADLW
ncbi:MAG: AEC family transporter [Labrys sp. (in: a-proteobacteria)]|jgi:malonate transporter